MDQDFELDLREVVNLNVRFIEFFGYFRPETQNKLQKNLYHFYAVIFVGFIFITYILSELCNMIAVFGDIEKMTGASFLLLTHLVHTSKLYVFVTKNKRVHDLINSTNRDEFKPRNKTQYDILLKDIKVSKATTKIFLIMGFATCTLWGIFPFLDINDGREKVRLPLSGWYPFDVSKSPVFEWIYAYQTIGALINGLANISMDTFLAGIIMVISGQLKVLNNAFQVIKTCNERDLLVQNIIHYKYIIHFADEMTSLFTKCIMAQFVVSVIIICLTMFQMSLVSVFSLQFLSMALYQACMVLEIFLWCYYGNEVILKSEQLTTSAYFSCWLNKPQHFQKNLIFFMTRSQVPLKLYAGGYFTLSLDTFKAIVKSSWSYFAVLNRVHSEQ